MSREEFLSRMKNITNMYSMPFKAEYMQPIHYACREYDKLAYEQQNEIERLNNIINTFEDDLEREVNISEQESMVGNYRYTVIHSTLEKMLKYFKELKESGNSE
ncbi:MAG: hypothetical protein J6T23_02585 [Elusimicrobia bacterium]|nr:hypothetical protein [Elusimicrobiota bacterium]